ncbi:NRAMP family divalent metal transporter [Neolewinella sp.]|uniref:NRAMP family divalent metal transporter n=1 Tax=Neolewinella sp. TaxID=2993543 RepID=UPI003B5304A4
MQFVVNCGPHQYAKAIATSSWGRALVWSLIAAAFIGPGTVATATRAGTLGGYGYLPVVALAALAGYVFMEMAARVTIVSQRPLGKLLRGPDSYRGCSGVLPPILYLAIAFGCAAYQAGNLLGALGGLGLLLPVSRYWLLPLATGVAALLWWGSTRSIGRVMTVLVVGMGLLFVVAAAHIASGENTVSVDGSGIDTSMLLALLGTTIVPYNFFLAAGLGTGSDLPDMRRGLGLSFGVGALITGCIVVVGSAAGSFISFGDLSATLQGVLGDYGRLVLGVGLFAAGFSSATTAPLAAALAGQQLLGFEPGGAKFRVTWIVVLLCGLTVGLTDWNMVGVIVAAQVINGLLLPFIALVVFLLANRRGLLGQHTNRWWQNAVGAGVLAFVFYKAGQFFWSLLAA